MAGVMSRRATGAIRLFHGLPSRRQFSQSFAAWRAASLQALAHKSQIESGPLGRLSNIVPPRQSRDITHRVGSTFGGRHSLRWVQPPKCILLVKKVYDTITVTATRIVIRHLRSAYPDLDILVEPSAAEELQDEFSGLLTFTDRDHAKLSSSVDLIVALGGDGTVLHTSSLFDAGPMPPVLGLNLGTLGFLLPFHLDQFSAILDDVVCSRAEMMLRMRLDCSVRTSDGAVSERSGPSGGHVMNEVSLHRGSSPHMTTLEAYVDGQHLTSAVADGLVIATPTGSTAYSLSAGGPIVHPAVQTLMLTPICPRSLSFRSVLLPSDVCIQLMVGRGSRSPAELSLDGREAQLLHPGEYLNVSMSPYPVPCITPSRSLSSPLNQIAQAPDSSPSPPVIGTGMSPGQGDSWVEDINEMLSFNTTFRSKGAGHLALSETD